MIGIKANNIGKKGEPVKFDLINIYMQCDGMELSNVPVEPEVDEESDLWIQ